MDTDVRIAGTLNGEGIPNPNYATVRHTPLGVYKINRTVASLKAAKSAVYTCTATISPRPGVANVIHSQQASSTLSITIGK